MIHSFVVFCLLFLGLRFRAVSFDTNTAIANYHSKMQQINITDIKTGQLFFVLLSYARSVHVVKSLGRQKMVLGR